MKKKTWVYILLAVIAALIACFAYIHRRVIRAAIKGEELPPSPHKHCCGKKDAAEPETAEEPAIDPIEEPAPEAEE